MTSQVKCVLYYSITGEPFSTDRLKDDSIECTTAILNIYTRDEGDIAGISGEEPPAAVVTELSVPDPIQKGQFFNSESSCLFLNKTGQVLQIDGHYLFKILMMRDAADPGRLYVKFEQQYFAGKHQWVDIPERHYPKAPPVTL